MFATELAKLDEISPNRVTLFVRLFDLSRCLTSFGKLGKIVCLKFCQKLSLIHQNLATSTSGREHTNSGSRNSKERFSTRNERVQRANESCLGPGLESRAGQAAQSVDKAANLGRRRRR